MVRAECTERLTVKEFRETGNRICDSARWELTINSCWLRRKERFDVLGFQQLLMI